EYLDLMQRALINKERPLPIPSSFLLDGDDRVAVVYRGGVAPEQIVKDAALLTAKPDALRDAAVMLPGRWCTEPYGAEPVVLAVARRLREAGKFAAARDYL